MYPPENFCFSKIFHPFFTPQFARWVKCLFQSKRRSTNFFSSDILRKGRKNQSLVPQHFPDLTVLGNKKHLFCIEPLVAHWQSISTRTWKCREFQSHLEVGHFFWGFWVLISLPFKINFNIGRGNGCRRDLACYLVFLIDSTVIWLWKTFPSRVWDSSNFVSWNTVLTTNPDRSTPVAVPPKNGSVRLPWDIVYAVNLTVYLLRIWMLLVKLGQWTNAIWWQKFFFV